MLRERFSHLKRVIIHVEPPEPGNHENITKRFSVLICVNDVRDLSAISTAGA